MSAGILLFREAGDVLEVLIGHPGGPYWAKKHEGAWTIPKGLVESGENAADAARREFFEETGYQLSGEVGLDLGGVKLRSGKHVLAWAIRGDMDSADASSNLVRLEWPRGSGRFIEFPEIDQLRWCSVEEAETLLNAAQTTFLSKLRKRLDRAP